MMRARSFHAITETHVADREPGVFHQGNQFSHRVFADVGHALRDVGKLG
jgi:hypothetical protein